MTMWNMKRSSWASGSGIGAFELDRVLRREDVERLVERIGPSLNRDAVLLHRLEQRRLRLRRRAVDFVGEHDVGEDRAGREHHLPAAGRRILLNQVGAGDVGRHQVGRELDAVELEVDDLGQRRDQQRLGEAGHADDQAVAADEQRQQHQVDHVVLADDQFLQLGDDLLPAGVHLVGQRDVVRRFEFQGFSSHSDVPLRSNCRIAELQECRSHAKSGRF